MSATAPFVIIGATGTQGGFTARHLLAAGKPVRALVRDPAGEKAKALAALGAELVQGDLDDPATLPPALEGAAGLFSVQRPDDGTDSELRQGLNLMAAAHKAGVSHIVHSSVCHVDEAPHFPGWDEGRWDRKYWTDKLAVENAVRQGGFDSWTILRPSFILQNLLPPKVGVLYPQFGEGRFLAPIAADSIVQIIAGEDIGRFGAASLLEPQRFASATIELASESLTILDMARILGDVLGTTVVAEPVGPEAAIAAGQPDKWVRSQEWINEAGYHIDLAQTQAWGVPMHSFAQWVELHRDEIKIGRRE